MSPNALSMGPTDGLHTFRAISCTPKTGESDALGWRSFDPLLQLMQLEGAIGADVQVVAVPSPWQAAIALALLREPDLWSAGGVIGQVAEEDLIRRHIDSDDLDASLLADRVTSGGGDHLTIEDWLDLDPGYYDDAESHLAAALGTGRTHHAVFDARSLGWRGEAIYETDSFYDIDDAFRALFPDKQRR